MYLKIAGLLLRVAKVPSLGASPTYDYLAQQQYFQNSIEPLLGEYVVHQELVILRKTGIVQELNNLLREINHTRKDKFKGSFIGQTDWGFVVEDMRPTSKFFRQYNLCMGAWYCKAWYCKANGVQIQKHVYLSSSSLSGSHSHQVHRRTQ